MSDMGRISVEDLTWEPGNIPGAEPRFDGEVRRASIVQGPGQTIALVQFVAGARTYWHTHPEEQVLVIIEGVCRAGTRTGDEQIAHSGQLVRLPGGVEHWHGAVAGTTMTHLSINTGGQATWNGPPTPR